MKKLPVTKLKSGMVLSKSIVTKRGQTIAKAGTVLTHQLIARFSFYKIDSVDIENDFTDEFDELYTPQPQQIILPLSEPVLPSAATDSSAKKEPVVSDTPHVHTTVEDIVSYSQKLKSTPEFQSFQVNYIGSMAILKSEFQDIIDGNPLDSQLSILLSQTSNLFQSKTSLELFELLHNMRSIEDSVYAHSLNVALTARAIGKWMKYTKDDLDLLTLAGLLHDVGKAQIPDEILNKQEKLTDEEFNLIKKHPLFGQKLLKKAGADPRLCAAALQHHERYDGSGYPRGLMADEIDDFAAIIAIADVYDAMTAARSYRTPKCAFQVIAAFEDEGLKKYNTKFILTFLERIAFLYQNSKVILNDGTVAKIIYINRSAFSRPTVQTEQHQTIDLSRNPDLYIQSIL